MALLGFEAQRGDRARIQALDADGLAGFLAIAIAAVLKRIAVPIGKALAQPYSRGLLTRRLADLSSLGYIS